MKEILTYAMDDLKCITFTEKGWNYIGTILLIISGVLWNVVSDRDDILRIIGCISYAVSSFIFITKSEWGKCILNTLFEDDNE